MLHLPEQAGLGPNAAPVRALIFDMDGTILDTRPFHMDSWRILVQELGLGPREYRIAEQSFGQTNQAIFGAWFGGKTPMGDYETLAARKEAAFRRLIHGHVRPRPGFVDLLDLARRHGVKIALATSAPRENATFILDALGVTSRFDALVWSAPHMQSKPHPDFFLAAAKRAGVQPSHCLGFEDSPHGLWAVRRAGMRLVAIAEQPADRMRYQKWTPYLYEDFRPVVRRLRQLWTARPAANGH